MRKGFHPRKLDVGELEAMRWLASVGADVWGLESGRFSVSICTNGGNQS